LEIGWVVTPPVAGSGGHNAIFLAANEMVAQGHNVVIYVPQAEGEGRALRESIRHDFQMDPGFEVIAGSPAVFSHDALIATHYSTAHLVSDHAARVYLPAYFVQDFEPFFSPIGSEYFDAERTYRYPFYCVTVGEWLADRLRSEFGREADAVPFWVNKELYHPGGDTLVDEPLRIAFLARPDMPRRCFTLGTQAIALFKRQFPNARVVLFGATGLPRGSIDFEFQDAGVLAKKDLADLYRRSHVGMAFSTTNPSLVPIEMMACGLPVVDLDVLESRRRLVGNPALLAEATPEAVAAALGLLATNHGRRAELRRAGLSFTADLPSPQEALAQVGRLILRKLS
jgi:glycosyltransferase involved in cell wall biosynthesis